LIEVKHLKPVNFLYFMVDRSGLRMFWPACICPLLVVGLVVVPSILPSPAPLPNICDVEVGQRVLNDV
jgi:hypothetical protein